MSNEVNPLIHHLHLQFVIWVYHILRILVLAHPLWKWHNVCGCSRYTEISAWCSMNGTTIGPHIFRAPSTLSKEYSVKKGAGAGKSVARPTCALKMEIGSATAVDIWEPQHHGGPSVFFLYGGDSLHAGG